MPPETLAALKATISHWETNLVRAKTREPLSMGTLACPLCRKFVADDCAGCPIYLHTGEFSCHGTPYASIYRHQRDAILFDDHYHEKLVRLVQAELDFLRSLLPKVDDISAEVSLSSVVLGIANSSLLSAVVVDQKTYGDLVAEVPKAPPGRRFEAFIIPYSAQTVRRVEGLSALTCALRGASPLT